MQRESFYLDALMMPVEVARNKAVKETERELATQSAALVLSATIGLPGFSEPSPRVSQHFNGASREESVAQAESGVPQPHSEWLTKACTCCKWSLCGRMTEI